MLEEAQYIDSQTARQPLPCSQLDGKSFTYCEKELVGIELGCVNTTMASTIDNKPRIWVKERLNPRDRLISEQMRRSIQVISMSLNARFLYLRRVRSLW